MKSLLLALALVAGCGDDDTGRCMVLTPTGVEPERTATFGYAAPEFTPYEAGGAYPIIMGMQGHTRLEQVLLGSVANKVVQRSAVPVLLVPIPPDD